MGKIKMLEMEVSVYPILQEDYVCLADIPRY
jgi:hypothetical protein